MNTQDQPTGTPTSGEPDVLKISILARLRNYFFAGILITAPAFITVYVAWKMIKYVDEKITPLIPAQYNPETHLPFSIPGLGLVILVVSLTLVGALTAGFVGRIVVRLNDSILHRMPILRSIYSLVKQIFEVVLNKKSAAFSQVVLMEYPRKGIWTLGFVSGVTEGEVQDKIEDDVLNVFVPTTPNPTSGFLLFIPHKDLTFLQMSVEDGIKMVVSGGLVTPKYQDVTELR